MRRALALVVDDEPDIRELLSLTLARMDIDCRTAADLATARALLDAERFDLCLTDMRLPDGDGLDLVDFIQSRLPETPVAVITAHGNMESAVQALKSGAFDFVSKPVDLQVLRRLVTTALRLRDVREPGGDSVREATLELLGDSPVMHATRATIAKLARSQAPVHIAGESGTGKELAARLIHEQGPRADGPFVPVNCGAIPEALMESEFFGHRKGSFTGATANKEGLFQAAAGGTLFLDEIADLPLHMQVKLLRALQEKAIRPIGEQREVPIDVRVLSATHRDLMPLVHSGAFRQDLYYRVNVIELRLPALRERPGDIPLLVEHLLAKLADEAGGRPPAIDANALEALGAYAFPGNVRELENVLERAMTLCEGGIIRRADLRIPSGAVGGAAEAPGAAGVPGAGCLNDGFGEPGGAGGVGGASGSGGIGGIGGIGGTGGFGGSSGIDGAGAAEGTGRPRSPDAHGPTGGPLPAGGQGAPVQLEPYLGNVERDTIQRALEQARYNKTAAARLLGISFGALRYRLKKLGLE